MTQNQIRITLISQIAPCPRGHKVGDSWTTDGRSPGGICMGALNTLIPAISTLRFGGNFPWMKTQGEGFFACPDHAVQNVFKVKRISP